MHQPTPSNALGFRPAVGLPSAFAALTLLLTSVLSGQADYTALVDPNVVVVTNFEGWGTSLCWWANVVGGYPNRETYADLAFSQLKLNIVRYNIGGGENPTNNFLALPGANAGLRTHQRRVELER